MSFSNQDEEDEFIQDDNNGLYFEKRHKKEETPYHIPEERQIYYKLLDSYFESICPKQSLDESIVNFYRINSNNN